MIELKARVTKDGQTIRRFKFSTGRRLSVGGRLGFETRQMLILAKSGVQTILDRTAKGIGSDDQPMKPLQASNLRRQRWSKSRQAWVEYGVTTGYRARKKRETGRSIRDLRYTGEMLGNLSVRYVSPTEARIDITSRNARMKARVNEIRSPWFGWSPRDVLKMSMVAGKLFGHTLSQISFAEGMGRPFGSAAIWMNPFGYNFPGSVDARWAEGLRARIAAGSLNRRPR